jgi:hypothetical protein
METTASSALPVSVLKSIHGSVPPALAPTSLHAAPMRIDFTRGCAPVECDANEKDVARLASYRTVVFAQPQSLPFLGWSVAAPSKSGKANKASKEKEGDKRTKTQGTGEKEPKAPKAPKDPPKPKHLDDSLVPALIRRIHGRKDGTDKLVKEFMEAHKEQEALLSKSNVEKKMKEVAKKSKAEAGHGTARWVVAQEHIEKAGLTLGDAAAVNGAADAAAGAPEEDGTLKPPTAFDLAPVVFTPPRAPKRVRPVKTTEGRGPAKSARLRGDQGALVKGMGDEWWPSPPASQEKGGDSAPKEPALPSNEDGEVNFSMDVQAEATEMTAEAEQGGTKDGLTDEPGK